MEEDKKYAVPQISEKTNLASDYVGSMGGIFARFDLFHMIKKAEIREEKISSYYSIFGLEKGDYIFSGTRMPLYEERYPEDEYMDVVTDNNRATVEKLNSLVNFVNEMIEKESMNVRKMKGKLRHIYFLSHGNWPKW